MTRTQEWKVRLYLFEEDRMTKARLVLDTGTTSLTGHGAAQCRAEETNVPEIGDELAAGRALIDLGAQLLGLADNDLEGMGALSPGTPERQD